MNTYYIGDIVYFYFMIHDSDGISGLAGETFNDFTAYYIIDGVSQAFTLSSANWGEVGSTGVYYLKVTTSVAGNQVLWVQGTNDFTIQTLLYWILGRVISLQLKLLLQVFL